MKKVMLLLLGVTLTSSWFFDPDFTTVAGVVYYYPYLPRSGFGGVFDISGRKGNKSQLRLRTKVRFHNIKAITVPNFSGDTLLKKLVVPKGYSFIDNFWNFHNLETIVLPSSLKSVSSDAFKGCESIKEFLFPHGNAFFKFQDGCLFWKQDSAILYSTNGSEIPEETRIICDGALANRRDTSVVFIPNNVVSIRPNAFGTNSSIKEVVFSPDNERFTFVDGNIITKKDDKLVCVLGSKPRISSKAKILCNGLFYNRNDIDSIYVPEGITNIERHCFYHSSLSFIHLPSSLRTIEWLAFDYTDLLSLEIPMGVENLDTCIGYCNKLERVSIPKSTKVVSRSAFEDCSHIKTVYLHSRDTKIEEGAFPPDAEIKYVDD